MTIEAAIRPDWIAVDWGTSHCRAWAMTANGSHLAHARSDRGMGTLTRDDYPQALLDLVGPWLSDRPLRAMVCGMAGSRQGWVEAPYTAVPCRPDSLTTVPAPFADPRLTVTVIGGVRQNKPADVMRGEETQIAGFLHKNPAFDGVLCLPGTHSKWAQVSAGEIVSFRTFMTGELFGLLSKNSVLRHSMGKGWDDEAFRTALSEAISRPESVAHRLFALRAESLLSDLAPATARARLSGLLIGMELAAARPYWLGQQVAVIGSEAPAKQYETALMEQGLTPIHTDGDAMTLAGLFAAYQNQKATA